MVWPETKDKVRLAFLCYAICLCRIGVPRRINQSWGSYCRISGDPLYARHYALTGTTRRHGLRPSYIPHPPETAATAPPRAMDESKEPEMLVNSLHRTPAQKHAQSPPPHHPISPAPTSSSHSTAPYIPSTEAAQDRCYPPKASLTESQIVGPRLQIHALRTDCIRRSCEPGKCFVGTRRWRGSRMGRIRIGGSMRRPSW